MGEESTDPTPRAPRSTLFLVGYRGTGKTTTAQLLAGRLGWDWLDADQVLEARQAKTIKQIFAEEGEAGFRDKEAALLAELCQAQRHVIATGGGIVLRPENRERLKATGQVVWLTADPATLWRRIAGDATTTERRPNLTVGGLAEVEQLLQVREPLYREVAQLIVDTARQTPAEVAEVISRWLARPPLAV
jgi:shikimate kinase